MKIIIILPQKNLKFVSMEADLICKKSICKLNKTPCRKHRNSNNWGSICHHCLRFCSPDLAVLNSTPLKWLIFSTYPPACVCGGLNICASLLLCSWTGIREQEMHNTALIAFFYPSLSAGLTIYSSFQTPVIQQKERKHVLSVETSLKWKVVKRNNQILIIGHQKGCWNKHVQHS